MSRQVYQKYGYIVALIIAGIALPTSIVSLTMNPTPVHHNYYNTYNNQTYYYYNQTSQYYNQTYYGNNKTESDYTKSLERKEYYNYARYDCFIRNFTLSSNFAYWFYWNASTSFQLHMWVIRDFFYDTVVALNGTIELPNFLYTVDVYQFGSTGFDGSSFCIPPFLSEWLFVFMMDQASITVNITLTDEILKI